MPRPPTNRAVAEEIAKTFEKYDRQELIGLLTHVTKTYVVDGTTPFNLTGKEGQTAAEAEKSLDFVRIVELLKAKFAHVPEMSYFTVEDGRVTIRVGNEKITFGERVTKEFVTASAPPPVAAAKGAAGAIAAAQKAAGGQKAPEKGEKISDAQKEALDDIVTRFKGLELD
jgi:hypothetical protein